MAASVSAEEAAADCPYINDYCRDRHKAVVRCTWEQGKGRILTSQKVFKQGDVIFRDPPLHIVAEELTNPCFLKLKELGTTNPQVFEYETLWYWTALCSLTEDQLPPGEQRLEPITKDQQRKLLLLYHPDVTEASEAAKQLVEIMGLSGYTDPVALEGLLQVWILNCFEHSDDPLGYSAYFMSSFMSHSCMPNAVWHYEGDDFVLRARCALEPGDEVCISYLSEDALLESVPARRRHLKDSKHFVCGCQRCSAEKDTSRGFKCPACGGQAFFEQGGTGQGQTPSLSGPGPCGHELTEAEGKTLLEEEKRLEQLLDRLEERLQRSRGRAKADGLLEQVEEATVRAERSMCQHFLLDRAWQLAVDAYDQAERPRESEALMRRRIAFQERAYPGLSGTRAWTLESYVDMLLRHAGAVLEPMVRVPSAAAARHLAPLAPPLYAQSLQILSLMFGEEHEYFTSVHRKAQELQGELDRLLR